MPETRYAETAAGGQVAYQVVGSGAIDVLVVIPIPLPVDLLWDEPRAVQFLLRLSSFARHIWFGPFYASWLNRIEAQFTALRYFALDGTDHPTHEAQGRMIRRYIAWRNRNAHDRALRELVKRANVA